MGSFDARYERKKLLGEGAFGSAFLVKAKDGGPLLVAKEIRITHLKEKEKAGALAEAETLKKMSHSNIIAYAGCFIEGSKLYILMEYADGGDLAAAIKSRKEEKSLFREREIMVLFVQIALALHHVHSRKILHRDLKPLNIFLTRKGVVKLGDFGIARILESSTAGAQTTIGTPFYLSPEICNSEAYGVKSDLWSLGIVTYEMAMLKVPFHGTCLPAVALKICGADPEPLPNTYSKELSSLVMSFLEKEPGQRPSLEQVIRSNYVQQYIQALLSHTYDNSSGGCERMVTKGHERRGEDSRRSSRERDHDRSHDQGHDRRPNRSERDRRYDEREQARQNQEQVRKKEQEDRRREEECQERPRKEDDRRRKEQEEDRRREADRIYEHKMKQREQAARDDFFERQQMALQNKQRVEADLEESPNLERRTEEVMSPSRSSDPSNDAKGNVAEVKRRAQQQRAELDAMKRRELEDAARENKELQREIKQKVAARQGSQTPEPVTDSGSDTKQRERIKTKTNNADEEREHLQALQKARAEAFAERRSLEAKHRKRGAPTDESFEVDADDVASDDDRAPVRHKRINAPAKLSRPESERGAGLPSPDHNSGGDEDVEALLSISFNDGPKRAMPKLSSEARTAKRKPVAGEGGVPPSNAAPGAAALKPAPKSNRRPSQDHQAAAQGPPTKSEMRPLRQDPSPSNLRQQQQAAEDARPPRQTGKPPRPTPPKATGQVHQAGSPANWLRSQQAAECNATLPRAPGAQASMELSMTPTSPLGGNEQDVMTLTGGQIRGALQGTRGPGQMRTRSGSREAPQTPQGDGDVSRLQDALKNMLASGVQTVGSDFEIVTPVAGNRTAEKLPTGSQSQEMKWSIGGAGNTAKFGFGTAGSGTLGPGTLCSVRSDLGLESDSSDN